MLVSDHMGDSSVRLQPGSSGHLGAGEGGAGRPVIVLRVALAQPHEGAHWRGRLPAQPAHQDNWLRKLSFRAFPRVSKDDATLGKSRRRRTPGLSQPCWVLGAVGSV